MEKGPYICISEYVFVRKDSQTWTLIKRLKMNALKRFGYLRFVFRVPGS